MNLLEANRDKCTGDGVCPSLSLDRIVFIGRTYDEYLRIFDLDESSLRKGPVLDCAAGPSSFTAEAHAKGYDVTACDMLYDAPPARLVEKGGEDIEHTFRKVDDVPHLYVWKHYRDKAEIIALRQRALESFRRDFPEGLRQGRYVAASLPCLPFSDNAFSLVLSSHFLFLYGDGLNKEFHVDSLKELAGIASDEVRIYPLQGLDAKPYPYMDEVLVRLRSEGIEVEIVPTPFEFQKGSDKMLVLHKSQERRNMLCR